MCLLFSFFTLKLFTLNSPAVRLTRELHLYCWDHVCKKNGWCLVDSLHHKFRVFFLQWAFNGPLGHFFVIQNIYINLNPDTYHWNYFLCLMVRWIMHTTCLGILVKIHFHSLANLNELIDFCSAWNHHKTLIF